jgi:HAD superfamily hydrolase (TIGR01549 family)
MMSNANIKAIIWDYDGTLVDTRHKNLNVTKNIIENVTETDALAFPALRSLENYCIASRRYLNWRELYRKEFKLTDMQINEAGRLWTAYQLKDDTEVDFYEGIEAVICELAEFSQGIVSQNSKSNIAQNLEKENLLPFFKYIVGYEEVDIVKQKPAPDGLLGCMEKLSAQGSGYVCYIGDHETDVQCVRAANRVLRKNNGNANIFSIGACYDNGADTSAWHVRPNFEAREVEDILEIIDHISRFPGK